MNTCLVCNKPLPKMPPSHQMKYCSRACMGKDRQTLPKIKTCLQCGKEWQPKTRYQAARNQTCSQTCAGKLARVTAPTPQVYRMAICLQCGKEYRLMNGIKTGKYCSQSCRAKANAAHLIPFSNNMKGRKRSDPRYGASNPAWKGGVTKKRTHGNYQGVSYTRCPAQYLPMARKDGYIMTHRLVMAQKLGRCLLREEVVHHIDHNPANNNPNNLELYPSNGAHKRAEGAASRLRLNGSKE